MVVPSLPPAEDLQLILKLILTRSLRYLSTTTSRLFSKLRRERRRLGWVRSTTNCIWFQGGITLGWQKVFMWNNFNTLSFYCIKTFSLDLAEILIETDKVGISPTLHWPDFSLGNSKLWSMNQSRCRWQKKHTLWFISHMCALWRLPSFPATLYGGPTMCFCRARYDYTIN